MEWFCPKLDLDSILASNHQLQVVVLLFPMDSFLPEVFQEACVHSHRRKSNLLVVILLAEEGIQQLISLSSLRIEPFRESSILQVYELSSW